MDGPTRKSIRLRRARLAAVLLCLTAVPGLGEETPAAAPPPGPPSPEANATGADEDGDVGCSESEGDGTALVDKMRRGLYLGVCGSAQWFDGLFGTRRYDQDSDATFGRLGIYGLWDDRDGFEPKLRLRARVALPAMERRLRLVLGRVDEREIESDTQPVGGALPSSFQEVEDDAWLLGLGYSKQSGLKNGFDFGAGIRLRTPVDPYVKGSYRHNFIFSAATALRARQTLFWRDSRGYGETTEIDLDHLLTPQLLLRWDNTATLAEDVRRLEWTSALITFQSLGKRRAIAYTGFVSGVANSDVPLRNYGVELRYRQRILREWLFLEARTSLTWPRETLEEERKINPGVGLGFEMYFGPVPENQMR
jgi:hypothetical protein